MNVVRDAGALEARPRAVAVGTFDGVHLGHREVIAGSDTVLTFEPHPIAVVAPGAAPRLLTDLRRKAQQYQAVDRLLKSFQDKEIGTELQLEIREIQRRDAQQHAADKALAVELRKLADRLAPAKLRSH